MITAVELGLIYAIVALGVYLTFRVLNFPDLTVDGSFTTGAGTAGVLIVQGVNPFLATAAAFLAGALAGLITGLLHTKGNINGLLAGILTMIGLYSINLRIMGASNVPLLGEDTLFTMMYGYVDRGVASIVVLIVLALLFKLALDWYLHTDTGMALQATGDNELMIRSFAVSTDRQKIYGLMISNGLVAVAGALVAQYQGFVDIQMGIGLILVGLASVIVGQAIFGSRLVIQATFAVVLGAVLYRLAIQFALNAGLNPNDMKLLSALLVIAALLLPQWSGFRKIATWRRGLGAGGGSAMLTSEGADAAEAAEAQSVPAEEVVEEPAGAVRAEGSGGSADPGQDRSTGEKES